VAELHGLSEQIALRLDDMETLIRTLSDNLVTGMHGQEERQAIFDRVRRLRELRNMMELGSFMIDVNRKMEAAWERLP
jgi:hypothetical protein